MLSQSVEDYLKIIYKLQKTQGRALTSAISDELRVSPASVTNMATKLAKMGLVKHTPYQGVELTKAGRKAALEIVRHHRLLELYLKEALGLSWDRVHAEAEKLEHALSEELEDKMAEILGNPETDPHGDPIPSKNGDLVETNHTSLAELEAGQTAVVRRVNDSDPELLRYLAELGLFPDTTVKVMEKAPFNGPLRLRVGDKEHSVGREPASQVFVSEEIKSQREGGDRS